MVHCPNCGATVAMDAGFCGDCGTALSTTASGAPADGAPGAGAGTVSRATTAADSRGVSRRTLLAGAGGLAVLGGGGYLAYTTLMGPSGPVGVARAFVSALDAGNVEEANSYINTMGSMNSVDTLTAAQFEESEVTIQSLDRQRISDRVVRVRMDLELARDGETAGRLLQLTMIDHRQGGWHVLEYQVTGQ